MIPYKVIDRFELGPLTIQAWGLMVALSFVVALIVSIRVAKKQGISSNSIIDLGFWIIVLALVGSRVFYIFGEIGYYLENPLDMFKVWQGGMAIYGGYIGAVVAGVVFAWRKKINFWKIADIIVFSLPLGLFVGRIGCFFIHDHLGKVTSVPWAVDYLGQGRHENAMYLSLNGLILFLVFLWLKKKPRFRGFYTTFFMIWYGFVRFWLDFCREVEGVFPTGDPHWLGLTPSQYVSIIMFVAGIVLFIRFKKHKSKEKSDT